MSAPDGRVSVLLVDDDANVSEAMARWLQDHASVRWLGSAASAAAALKMVTDTRPRVVLMDIGLRQDEPFGLLEDMLRTAPDTRVIMFTGYLSKELVTRSLGAGAAGYVLKDVEPDEILRLIHEGASGGLALCDLAQRALTSAGDA